MGETLKFSSPEVLASYLYTRCEPYTYSPLDRIYLATLCSERAAKLWMKYADGGEQ